jgi:hypothetical protein
MAAPRCSTMVFYAVSTQPPDDWSPADHPYAIAVSEAQWWKWAVQLAAARLAGPDNREFWPISSRQVDARNLVLALSQLLRAEHLEQFALDDLGLDPAAGQNLRAARAQYLEEMPGLEHMRNALTHFDAWARGAGLGPQKRRVDGGDAPRDVARDFWGFGYDPGSETISFGPYRIHVPTALQAALAFTAAIHTAARAVDEQSALGHERKS